MHIMKKRFFLEENLEASFDESGRKESDLGTRELSGKVVLSDFEEQLFYTREM